MTGTAVTVRSPAKINWTLRVLRRRDDGYHDIESLVSAVTLYDELTFSAVDAVAVDGIDGNGTDGVSSTVELVCNHPAVPTDDRNLILKAAAALSGPAGRRLKLRCSLDKRIPVGGGLGGGSSNAAATLLALNRLWSLNWSVEQLMPVAAGLGSDVPFFLHGGSAVIRGRGEQVEPVQVEWGGWIVLLLPVLSISTGAVYAEWRTEGELKGTHQDEWPIINTVGRMEHTFNMLEEAAMRVCPELREMLGLSTELAGRPVRLSGSGSSMFSAFDTREEAERFSERVGQGLGLRTCLVQLWR